MAHSEVHSTISGKGKSRGALIVKIFSILLFAAPLAFLSARMGFKPLVITLVALIASGVIVLLFKKPKLGIYIAMLLSVFLPTLERFVYPIPYGLMVEVLLLLVYIVLFFKHFKKLSFAKAKNPLVIMMLLWFAYIVLQLGNPNAHSMVAWAYAMRGIALFQLLLIPLVFMLMDSEKDLKQFLVFYISVSFIAIFWGIKQHLFGLTSAEYDYVFVQTEKYLTHFLHGKLRIFSINNDAGNFGAAMGHLCIISSILFLGPFKPRHKYGFIIVALISFYAMMISGTRGALAIPAFGAMLYVILIKNVKYILLGLVIISFGFVFLKFTYIGQSNYNIYRLRTALNPDDPSLNVRIENRQRLTEYLSDKPFGGGVGTVGVWGQQFSPGTWLANFPPDGLYTRIRAETGRVGYSIYLAIWIGILLLGIRQCWSIQNERHKNIAIAFLCGYAGILVANYGNEVMTQYPSNFVVFITLSYVFIIKQWDEKPAKKLPPSKLKG